MLPPDQRPATELDGEDIEIQQIHGEWVVFGVKHPAGNFRFSLPRAAVERLDTRIAQELGKDFWLRQWKKLIGIAPG